MATQNDSAHSAMSLDANASNLCPLPLAPIQRKLDTFVNRFMHKIFVYERLSSRPLQYYIGGFCRSLE